MGFSVFKIEIPKERRDKLSNTSMSEIDFLASDSEEETELKCDSDDGSESNADEPQIDSSEDGGEDETNTENKDDEDVMPKRKRRRLEFQKKLKAEELRLTELLFGNKEKVLKNLDKPEAATLQSEKEDESTKERTPKPPVWHDSDDDEIDVVNIRNIARRVAPIYNKSGKYQKVVESKFERVVGAPKWAKPGNKPEADSDDDDNLLQSVGHVVSPGDSKLMPNLIKMKKLKDLNRTTYLEGPLVTGVQFHPTSSVALVSGKGGIASIFAVDGKMNDKLHTIKFKNYEITKSQFSPDGSCAVFGGVRRFYYIYNLLTGVTDHVTLPKDVTKLSNFEISPCGKYMASVGRFGEIHLFDFKSREMLCTLSQQHRSSGLVFAANSTKLISHSVDSEVTIFDLRAQRMEHKFYDDGCINGSAITISPNSQMVATGSGQGIVNVYSYDSIFANDTPKPLKIIDNLTTGISDVKFNSTSELLALCSKDINNSLKLAHFPSGLVYSNFPTPDIGIGKPSVLAFSPNSGYFAVGTKKTKVSLFRVKHFNNY